MGDPLYGAEIGRDEGGGLTFPNLSEQAGSDLPAAAAGQRAWQAPVRSKVSGGHSPSAVAPIGGRPADLVTPGRPRSEFGSRYK